MKDKFEQIFLNNLLTSGLLLKFFVKTTQTMLSNGDGLSQKESLGNASCIQHLSHCFNPKVNGRCKRWRNAMVCIF